MMPCAAAALHLPPPFSLPLCAQLQSLSCLSALSISAHANKRSAPGWMAPLSALPHLTRLHFAWSSARHPFDTGLLLGVGQLTHLRELKLGMAEGGLYAQVRKRLAALHATIPTQSLTRL